MYMCGRLRTASSPSSTLIASVPYSSAPFGRGAVFSAVSSGFSSLFSKGSGARAGLWVLAGAHAPFNARVRWTNPREYSRNERLARPVPHPEEGAPGTRRRLEEAAVRRGEEHLRRQGREVA